jgi:hypothetical protein
LEKKGILRERERECVRERESERKRERKYLHKPDE